LNTLEQKATDKECGYSVSGLWCPGCPGRSEGETFKECL